MNVVQAAPPYSLWRYCDSGALRRSIPGGGPTYEYIAADEQGYQPDRSAAPARPHSRSSIGTRQRKPASDEPRQSWLDGGITRRRAHPGDCRRPNAPFQSPGLLRECRTCRLYTAPDELQAAHTHDIALAVSGRTDLFLLTNLITRTASWIAPNSTRRRLRALDRVRATELSENLPLNPRIGTAGWNPADLWLAASVVRDMAALAGVESPWDYWGIGRVICATRQVAPVSLCR